MPAIDPGRIGLSEDRLAALRVTMGHFVAALSDVEPSAIREVVVETPDVGWADLGGLDAVKGELQDAVEWPLRHPELLRRLALRPPKGILLHGPPGTGKTMLAKALAAQAGVNFVSVKGPALLSKYVGESERGVREIFKRARQAAPCILFFDEVDALAPARGGDAGDGQVGERVTGQLLTELDGIEELNGVLVVAATNRKDRLDPALLRPGRFDLLLEVPPPDDGGRGRIFERNLRDKPLARPLDPVDLARRTPGFTGAAIEVACRRAALLALRRSLAGGGATPLEITQEDLVAAIEETRRAHGPAGA
jgi:transitional endoplasmic reticulum ATPase